MNKVVRCRVLGVTSWEGDPERNCVFKTEDGFCFTRKTKEIPWQVQNAVDTFGEVMAEVSAEPDDLGSVAFVRFIIEPTS